MSGGGVKISVDNISGSGSITSNGGSGYRGGGGGRIAVYYKEGTFPWDTITAYGGDGRDSYDGGEGTVLYKE